MIRADRRARTTLTSALGLAVALAGAVAGCGGLPAGPWAPATPPRAPAAHADVQTLNTDYARLKSGVLVRRIERPTRAALDWAAYHANFMIADAPPEGARPHVAPDTSNPFGGLVEKTTLTGDIGRTPLTEAERLRPIAVAPAVEWVAAHKVEGADALGDLVAAVRGEAWGQPGGAQVPPQLPAELYLHEAGGGAAELWLKIEFQPWFAAATFRDPPDQDGDGVPEIYGRVRAGAVPAPAVAALAGEYSTKVLTPAEIKLWANQLSSYWYPSFNTDLVPPGAAWPDDHTEADIKQELGARTFEKPTFVLRGKPAGKPVYDVFLVGAGTGTTAGGAAAPAAAALKLAPTKPSPNPKPVADAVAKELAAHGGSWPAWQTEVAPIDKALRARIKAMGAAKALAGVDGFLFFRNSLDYAVGGDLAAQPAGKNPVPIIVEFQKMLASHGVDFLFVPVPTKVEIFPDKLDPALHTSVGQIANPFERKLLADLAREGVETVDLLPAILAARARGDKKDEEPLYQRQDTHWTDRGLRLAAEIVAARIKAYPWYAELSKHAHKLGTKPATFTRFGDLHSRLPDAQKKHYKPETLRAEQVVGPGGALYDDDADSPIVLLGDSFTGVYELTESEHAGVSAHVARDVGYPLDLVMSYGGGPNVRQKLMRRGVEGLANKKLVIWMMTARDLYNYWEDWSPLKVK
jgi:alginate O-acetyltransferase complex protein AlgJ